MSGPVTTKNWLPEVPGASFSAFAIATTPFVYAASLGGVSTVLYPGPPPPVPVGSPPWMTKPGTTRWNVVPSKKPLSASETREAAVFGAVFWSSSIVNEPQFVWIDE